MGLPQFSITEPSRFRSICMTHLDAPPYAAVDTRGAPPSIAAAVLADRGQQPINRGADQRQNPCPQPLLQQQTAVLIERFHQLRQQRMKPLAALPGTGFPLRYQCLNHLGAVTATVLAPQAALLPIRSLVQPA